MKRTICLLTGTAVCMGCLVLASCGTKKTTSEKSGYEAYLQAFENTAKASNYTVKGNTYTVITSSEAVTSSSEGTMVMNVSGDQCDLYSYKEDGSLEYVMCYYYTEDYIYQAFGTTAEEASKNVTYQQYYLGNSKNAEKYYLYEGIKSGVLCMNRFSSEYFYSCLTSDGNGNYTADYVLFAEDFSNSSDHTKFNNIEISIRDGYVSTLKYTDFSMPVPDYYSIYDIGTTSVLSLDIDNAVSKVPVFTTEE